MTAPAVAALSVRTASMRDLATRVALMHEFHAEAGWRLDDLRAAEASGRVLAHPSRGAVWLATEAGQPVGHAVLSLRRTLDHGGVAADGDDLVVRPGCRRRRNGGALHDALVAHARALGCRSRRAKVGAANGATRALCASRGLDRRADDRLLPGRALGDAPTLSWREPAPGRAVTR